MQHDDDKLLDRLQSAAFDYFRQTVNPLNGLVQDTSRPGSPASIACVGFALAAYPVGVERDWMTHEDAVALTLTTLRFFQNSPQSADPKATGNKGFYYHFLDMESGRRTWDCELSLIDTALLLAGMLTAGCYFSADTAAEAEIRALVAQLYGRVDWVWAQNGGTTLAQGWKPEYGFMHRGWEGYNEATILYLLALASTEYPLPGDSYAAWTRTYQWENIYGHDVLYAGPLFIHQFSHIWVDFRAIQDDFMREKNFDYFRNSRHATLIQRKYAEHNPNSFSGYAADCWGLSSGDGPGGVLLNVEGHDRRCFTYTARGVPFGPDDGTISPPAVVGSLPFAPEIVMPAIRHILKTYPGVLQAGQLSSGFNATAVNTDGLPWVSQGSYGLDQGLMVLMIENYRSQMIWKLMRNCQPLRNGLLKAGFSGGWLNSDR
ncbi:MAG: hypothetical protein M3N08_06385 [Pseudomonadota bacterium]|nr:hypothetical protein [Pseudomonadota bacterium]